MSHFGPAPSSTPSLLPSSRPHLHACLFPRLRLPYPAQHVGHFDRVVTMEHGVVVEDGPPRRLLTDEKKTSRLAAMVARAGLVAEEMVSDMMSAAMLRENALGDAIVSIVVIFILLQGCTQQRG